MIWEGKIPCQNDQEEYTVWITLLLWSPQHDARAAFYESLSKSKDVTLITQSMCRAFDSPLIKNK